MSFINERGDVKEADGRGSFAVEYSYDIVIIYNNWLFLDIFL